MKIVLPIAGRGSRFKAQADKNPEYNRPKPIINVKGWPMVRWATGSLPFVKHKNQKMCSDLLVEDKDIVFIALREHANNHEMGDILRSVYGDRINIIYLDKVTRGAAETAIMAKDYINSDEPVIISDSDHFLDGEALMREIINNPKIDGLIPVFKVEDGNPKWSFSRLGNDGYVDLVAEKQPISIWANIGAYYFGSGKKFIEAAEEMIAKNELTNNEFYLAPVYNKIIQKGGRVKLAYPKYVYGLGTPEDLEYFLTLDYKL